MKLIIDIPDGDYEFIKDLQCVVITRGNAKTIQKHIIDSIKQGKIYEGKQGERVFIEIITRYFPDDIIPYPEYRGKPYYSIHYRENGEEFVGYGTYNPDVLSSYLRNYFFGQKGSEKE